MISQTQQLRMHIQRIRDNPNHPDFREEFPAVLLMRFKRELRMLCNATLEIIDDQTKAGSKPKSAKNPLNEKSDEQLKAELESLRGVSIHADRVTRFGPGQDRRHAHLAPMKRELLAEIERRGIEI